MHQSSLFSNDPELAKMHAEMLDPTVCIDIEDGSGTGTIIYSAVTEKGVETYVLTSFHVVSSTFVSRQEVADEETLGGPVVFGTPVEVVRYRFNSADRVVGFVSDIAVVVAVDQANDIAILKLLDTEHVVRSTAHMAPRGSLLPRMTKVFIVGANAQHPPVAKEGRVGYQDAPGQGGVPRILTTGMVEPGNSGGGLFRYSNSAGRYELVGIAFGCGVTSANIMGAPSDEDPHKVAETPDDMVKQGAQLRFPMFQDSYFVPLSAIYDLLDKIKLKIKK